jgi:hypothetical protein
MTSHEFINLNVILGHTVIFSQNNGWLLRDDRSAISLPTLENINPTRLELRAIFSKGAKIITFKTDTITRNSYEYVFEGNSYGMEQFDSKARNQIRKGLKSCLVIDAALEDLIKEGYSINTQTLAKQERNVDYLGSKDKWIDYISKLQKHKDVYIKGAYAVNKLIAYTVFIKVLDKYYIYHPFMDRNHSALCPMNAIIYTFINEVLKNENAINISYGMASYAEKSGLDNFKKSMLFAEVECTRVTAINPWLKLMVNRYGSKMIKLIAKTKLIDKSYVNKYEYLLANKYNYNEYIELMCTSSKLPPRKR